MRSLLAKIACKLGLYKFCVKIDTRIRNARLAKAFKKHGLEMYAIASETLAKAGVTFFPTAGTLLGVYREKNFLKGDFDLDAGILYAERPSNIVEVLEAQGFELVQQMFFKETGTIVEDRFMYKGVQLDIFYYFEDGEDFYCYFARRHETKDWRQANREDGFPTARSYVPKCDFVQQDFLGLKIWGPAKTGQWLADIYGASFMTPIKHWDEFAQKTRIVYRGERVYRKY